ncbi:MAG: BON domain-containing protein [Acidobacteria bacterium]|nr:BON domain-containing protein [Acidobacteriota bacterium]
MFVRLLIGSLLALAGMLQAQSRPAPGAKPAAHAGTVHHRPKAVPARSGSAVPDDAALESRIRERLGKSKLGTDPIRVSVRGGVATFEGETAVIQRKGSATRMAKSAGVARVENRIRLSAEARVKAAANLAKGRRRAQVVRGLRRDQR